MLYCAFLSILSAAFASHLSVAAAAAGADLIEREVFFGNPDRATVRISPDGSHIGFLAPHNGVLNVWVQQIGQADARAVTNATDRPVASWQWAFNNEQVIYSRDTGGDENYRLYAVDINTAAQTDLTPLDNIQARIVKASPSHPDELVVAINNRNPSLHDLWLVNLRTGQRELIYQNNDGYVAFLCDGDFTVRVRLRFTASGGLVAHMRNAGDAEWYQFAKWNAIDAAVSGPLGFTRDGNTLFVTDARDRNTAALFAFRIEPDGSTSYELIAEDSRADFSNVVTHPRTGEVDAVAFEYAREEWQIVNQKIAPDWNYLETVTRGDVNVTSRSFTDQRWIVAYTRDNGPVEYYLYERADRKAYFLFTNRSELEQLTLAEMKPVVIQARDGLKLVSYLTTPHNAVPENLPMVLLVHGGPWSRDSWGYDSLHQWLANRGYAVLSVNFRGSTGFGKSFVAAGNREWARRMHDDLIDAVNWAVDEGIANPDRVAIMGGSYGGYATLVGLTFTPEYFAAGVDIVGPSNVKTLLESIPPYWEPMIQLFETRVGSLDDPEYLESISPLTRVNEIVKPLLIGQGANDPRVKVQESDQIVQAMKQRGIPVTYVLFPDEGHGFARPENRMAFFAVTEAFLAKHLGGQYQPIDHAVTESSATIPAGAGLVPGLSAE